MRLKTLAGATAAAAGGATPVTMRLAPASRGTTQEGWRGLSRRWSCGVSLAEPGRLGCLLDAADSDVALVHRRAKPGDEHELVVAAAAGGLLAGELEGVRWAGRRVARSRRISRQPLADALRRFS
jgi:hypothetical protein